MTDEFKKPVFFSANLHNDLETAFDDLAKIHSMLTQIVRNMEETADRPENEAIRVYLRDTADLILGQSDELEKWTTTYSNAVCEQLENNHLVYERDAYQTLTRVLQWDIVDVRQLARWIRELKELTAKIGLTMPYLLHVRQIPSEPIPEDVAKYPVFVMDRQGYCLCGMGLDEILSLDEVRDRMDL
ncbi:MAG TPA: hypothetical protein O0X48_00460 [Methanocorpusculum sp.]|jgi:hypothetical protein|nr:hypothetical protein [Methanocorpusculum sp.]MBR5007530.1 hypothetical protein [Methanocorpusculum sp.]MBR5451076.1 hypothetical protein [Methanocorpusculum sp.]HJJ64767.1 hypothetical protein [Methanocorpusculum sp.]HJJ85210.1 hypothetical protein [Methanocorpusculum sp.]